MPRQARPWYWEYKKAWYVKLNGKQIRLHEDKKEADKAYFRLMADSGHLPPVKEPKLRNLFDDFLDHTRQTVKSETWEWYRVFVQDFADQFPALKANAVTETHVQKWLKLERKRRWGATTQRSAITILKAAFNWAVKSRRLQENPIRHMAKPAATRRDRIPSPEERAYITGLFPVGDPFHDFLTAMEESGARPGEIMRLTAADVNLAEGVAVLYEHKVREKTGKSRTIYLTAKLGGMLESLIRRHPQGELFRNEDGNPWNRQAVNCRFRRKKNRKTDPIDKSVVAYLWRHGWTTDALENGVPIATVAELLGHQGTAIVSAHYSHLGERKEHLKNAMEQATKKAT